MTPEWLVRFIGVVEFLGALGMILPALTRILPWLTPLAALGFAVIQVLAIGTHAALGEIAMTLRLVHAVQVAYTDANSNSTALNELTNGS